MDDKSTEELDDSRAVENPLDAIFGRAVRPFTDPEELRRALPADAPIMLLKKSSDAETVTKELPGGGTLRIPVLDALKNSKVAEWSRASEFDFGRLKHDQVGLVFLEDPSGAPQFRVITRASEGALLLADLTQMLDGVAEMMKGDLVKVFPGGDLLFEQLATGIRTARDEMMAALSRPDGSGKSLIEQFRAQAARPKPAARSKKK